MYTRQTISYGLNSKDVIEMTLLMLEKKFNHEQVLASTHHPDTLCQGLQQGYSANEMHDMRNTVMANSMHSSSKGFYVGSLYSSLPIRSRLFV